MRDLVVRDGLLWHYDGPGGLVRIPEGITEIMPFAFERCSKITGVRKVEDSAFAGCENLRRVSLPAGAEAEADAFRACGADVVYRPRIEEG